MPYKHKNIEYGLPHEQYPKERIKESIEQLKEAQISSEVTTKQDAIKYIKDLYNIL